ncbi:hypothetical protein BDV18DRAFT_28218 [Aspergillus unguis]
MTNQFGQNASVKSGHAVSTRSSKDCELTQFPRQRLSRAGQSQSTISKAVNLASNRPASMSEVSDAPDTLDSDQTGVNFGRRLSIGVETRFDEVEGD